MPHKAALSALASADSIKTNAVVLGGMALASLADMDGTTRSLVLLSTLIYSASKAVSAFMEAKRSVKPAKPTRRRKKR